MKEVVDFDEILLNSIDEILSILGENGKYALFYHVEKSFQIKPSDIPEKLDDFHNAMEEFFGVGAKIVERLIAEKMYEKLGLAFRNRDGWTLKEYAENAQKTKDKWLMKERERKKSKV